MKKRTRKKSKMVAAVAFLKEYFDTYDQQVGYERYKDETLIDDTLYGLGLALGGDEYRYARGFEKFKKRLIVHLSGGTE